MAMNGDIIDIKEYHKENKINFLVKMNNVDRLKPDEIEKKFKLTSTISCNNFVLFDDSMRLKRY